MDKPTPETRAFIEWVINTSPNSGARRLGLSKAEFKALRRVLGGTVIASQLRNDGKPWETVMARSQAAIQLLPKKIQQAIVYEEEIG